MPVPTQNGEVCEYRDTGVSTSAPRIYYVNGIQTTGEIHEGTALVLSQITQHTITGVFNRTFGEGPGIVVDLLQCFGDSSNGFFSQLAEFGFDGLDSLVERIRRWTATSSQPPTNVAEQLRARVPRAKLAEFITRYLAATNKATAALFRQLNQNRGPRQLIVAHSQGNLITSNALWAIQTIYGASSLSNLRIYSIASPAPAWPAGIDLRIKVYGHANDPVTLFDPKWLAGRKSAGDNKRLHGKLFNRFRPHDVALNFFGTNFVSRIRSDLGLGLMEDSRAKPQRYLPGDRVHVVNVGESLALISKKYFGKVTRWQDIYARNKDVVGADPNRISPGMHLIIPAITAE
jgi:nucleoid-associated protein YgaU